jgi:hypothetical protein
MSMSVPDSNTPNQGQVTLPPGVTVGPARETSQLNAQGQVVQGVNLPVSLPNGGALNVFIPYTALTNPAQVQQLLDERINAILQLPGQQ